MAWKKSEQLARELNLTTDELVLAKSRYQAQRKAALFRRDIEWDFTFIDWCKWWIKELGDGWLYKRGRNKGQYVMARKGDVGPYSKENVKCVLTEQNCSERIDTGSYGDPLSRGSKGTKNGRATLTEGQVIAIYLAEGTYNEVAKEHGVKMLTVYYIKTRKTWKNVTKNLASQPKRTKGARYDLHRDRLTPN